MTLAHLSFWGFVDERLAIVNRKKSGRWPLTQDPILNVACSPTHSERTIPTRNEPMTSAEVSQACANKYTLTFCSATVARTFRLLQNAWPQGRAARGPAFCGTALTEARASFALMPTTICGGRAWAVALSSSQTAPAKPWQSTLGKLYDNGAHGKSATP